MVTERLVCYLGYFHVSSLFNLTEPAEVHMCGCGGYMARLLCKIVPTFEVQPFVQSLPLLLSTPKLAFIILRYTYWRVSKPKGILLL